MRYPILIHPDKRLEQKTKEVKVITKEIIQLLDDLQETMIAHDGIGIAAPQVGKAVRVALVEDEAEQGLFELINPEIIHSSGSSIDVEGCLSFPELYGTVERANEVTVRYYNREGEELEVTVLGYLARAFQHEIDHLEGQLFVDKIIDKISVQDLDEYMEGHQDD